MTTDLKPVPSFDFLPVLASERTPIVELLDKLSKYLFYEDSFAHLSIKQVARLCQKYKIKWIRSHKAKELENELIVYFDNHDRILTPNVNIVYYTEATERRGDLLHLKFDAYNPYHHGKIVSTQEMEALSHETTKS